MSFASSVGRAKHVTVSQLKRSQTSNFAPTPSFSRQIAFVFLRTAPLDRDVSVDANSTSTRATTPKSKHGFQKNSLPAHRAFCLGLKKANVIHTCQGRGGLSRATPCQFSALNTFSRLMLRIHGENCIGLETRKLNSAGNFGKG